MLPARAAGRTPSARTAATATPGAPRPRRRSRSERKAEGNGAPAEGSVKLFVNRGLRSGVTEDDLRWALTEGAVVPEAAITDVRVLERFSFVELDAEHAHSTVERLDGTKLKDRQLRVEVNDGRNLIHTRGFVQAPAEISVH